MIIRILFKKIIIKFIYIKIWFKIIFLLEIIDALIRFWRRIRNQGKFHKQFNGAKRLALKKLRRHRVLVRKREKKRQKTLNFAAQVRRTPRKMWKLELNTKQRKSHKRREIKLTNPKAKKTWTRHRKPIHREIGQQRKKNKRTGKRN